MLKKRDLLFLRKKVLKNGCYMKNNTIQRSQSKLTKSFGNYMCVGVSMVDKVGSKDGRT